MLNHNWKANCDWSTEDGMEITTLRDISGRVDEFLIKFLDKLLY